MLSAVFALQWRDIQPQPNDSGEDEQSIATSHKAKYEPRDADAGKGTEKSTAASTHHSEYESRHSSAEWEPRRNQYDESSAPAQPRCSRGGEGGTGDGYKAGECCRSMAARAPSC